MKTVFKPLGIAAAVAAVTAGYTGVASADTTARNVGDLGLIPYYTTQGGYATAIHIINTTAKTQVVKLRARRGSDSQDSLDFNIIMSPEDMWVGSMSKLEDDRIVIRSDDNTCTAPRGNIVNENTVEWVMPDAAGESLIDYRTGAEEGYIEIIGMAETIDEDQAIAIGALHGANGEPADCVDVRRNFFRVADSDRGTESVKGVHLPDLTSNGVVVSASNSVDPLSRYTDTQDDALKVSWAVTDGNAGLEVGGNAVHIDGFASDPMMTNQQVQVIGSFDPLGYLFPDLDGGSPGFGERGLFDSVIRVDLGVSGLANDWSSRDVDGTFTVNTDWVVTMPGQYLMVDPEGYNLALIADNPLLCLPGSCDYRDIPASVAITYRDREEAGFTPEEGGLVVSPAVSGTPEGALLRYEVNVIEWEKGGSAVLDSDYALSFAPLFEGDRGWANLSVTSASNKAPQSVFDYTDPNNPAAVQNPAIPVIGFAAWERNFANNPAANYGRAVDHSYGS